MYIAQYLSTSTSTMQKRRKDLSNSTSTFIAVLTVLVQVPMYVAPYKQERVKEMAKVYSSEYVSENNLTIIVKMFAIHTYYTIF